MSNRCNFSKCCVCLYGNECTPTLNLPNEYTLAPCELIIQRLNSAQYSQYRDIMILTLKKTYNYEFSESNNLVLIGLKSGEYISQDPDLEDCPFCGGPAELYITKHIPKGYDFTPRCKKTHCCGRLTKKYTSRKDALHCWNMRIPTKQIKRNLTEQLRDLANEIHSMRNLSEAGIEMIDTDSIFFSSYDSALRYAKSDPTQPFSKFSATGQVLYVREDDGHIGRYFIASDRSLQKIESDTPVEIVDPLYRKFEIDKAIQG